jgi:DNA mismatch repair ATPase MutL
MSFARGGKQVGGEGVGVEDDSVEGESDEEVDELEDDDSLRENRIRQDTKKARSRKSGDDSPMDIDDHDEAVLPNTAYDDHPGSNPAILKSTRHSETPSADDIMIRPEIIRNLAGENISMRFDFSRVSEHWRNFQGQLLDQSQSINADVTALALPSLGQDAGVSNVEDDSKAAEALSRVIDKEDFGSMDIIGQFNLGFIVTRRKKAIGDGAGGEMDDLFIVDQHAADEKYNFETLQQTTIIKSQKLFRWAYLCLRPL